MKQKLVTLPGKTICDFELPAGTRVMHIVTNGVASTLSEDEPFQDRSGHGKRWHSQRQSVHPHPSTILRDGLESIPSRKFVAFVTLSDDRPVIAKKLSPP